MDSYSVSLRGLWNRFFFSEAYQPCCGIFRIAYATLLLINVLVWWPDLNKWFRESGVLDYATSRTVIDPDAFTLFAWLPKTGFVLWSAYLLLIGHNVMLLVKIYTRMQAIGVYVWCTSFQHRNLLIFDEEDYLFRLFAYTVFKSRCVRFVDRASFRGYKKDSSETCLLFGDAKELPRDRRVRWDPGL
mgnify:CR=1 FL=1